MAPYFSLEGDLVDYSMRFIYDIILKRIMSSSYCSDSEKHNLVYFKSH